MNENLYIQEKIIHKMNNNPSGVEVIEVLNITYNDIDNLWLYFASNSEPYKNKYGDIELEWNQSKRNYYQQI